MGASHVVVGLGNPGDEYEATRHNVGFMVVDRLAQRLGCAPIRDRKYGALAAKGRLGEHELLLVKPQGYMNRSGDPVRKAVGDAGLPEELWPERLIVVHDELDLPVGRLKLQASRGAGGHNGIRSIIGSLGTNAFVRVRFGVDKAPAGRRGSGGVPPGKPERAETGADWVLSPFAKSERPVVDETIERAAEAVEAIVLRGLDAASNEYNRSKEAAAK